MIINKEKKQRNKQKCNILLFCSLLDTCTNKQYRRVNSGGVECSRSSRRGTGLSSASLGSALDSDGQQGHAVVTQKRKLRTPVWARLRNIHISDLTRLFTTPLPRPTRYPRQPITLDIGNIPFTCWHLFLSISSSSLLRVTIMRRFARSLASIGGIESRYNRTEFGSIDRVDSEKWIRRWGLKAKSWRGMFPFRRWLMWNDFFLRVKFLSFPPCLFLPLYKCYQHNNINREIEVLKIILDLNILLIYLVRVVKFFMHRKLFINYNKLNIFYLFNVMLCLKKIIDKENNRMIIREKL